MYVKSVRNVQVCHSPQLYRASEPVLAICFCFPARSFYHLVDFDCSERQSQAQQATAFTE